MFKSDLQSENSMLTALQNSFNAFLKEDVTINSIERIGSESEFGKQVSRILLNYENNNNVKNLDFQYQKIIQIGRDIRHFKLLTDDEKIPEWLVDELESVYRKIKRILSVLEQELN